MYVLNVPFESRQGTEALVARLTSKIFHTYRQEAPV